MRGRTTTAATICALAAFLVTTGDAQTSRSLPHLERRSHATQLIVDGAPWLILGAELRGTASSTLSNMDPIWPELNRLHLNTVLLALGWDWIEPTEGHFDFTLVDGLIATAKEHHLRIVFLWFGTWKNGISSFAPSWVKSDQHRFPRSRLSSGRSVEIISPFSINARDADTRAYSTLMRHLRDTDVDHTVLMMQMENEVGLNGDTRDRDAAAEAAFTAPVPHELLDSLARHKASLSPALAQRWAERGSKSAGSWSDVFGDDVVGDEIFMAWNYARYLDHVSAVGKAIYPLPVFTNTALDEPWDKRVKRASSGGPQYYLLDVWKAGAPSIDFNGPDIYSANFAEMIAAFDRPDNAVFPPESLGDSHGVANAFYAVGAHRSLGYSPFGIDDTSWLINFHPDKGAPGTDDIDNTALAKGYAVLGNLAPAILTHQADGSIAAAWLNKSLPHQEILLGDYVIDVELRRSTRDQSFLSELGYALIMTDGPNGYLVAGSDVQITFRPRSGEDTAGLADAEVGRFVDDKWVSLRKANGDDVLLNYDLAGQAQIRQSGSGLRFLPGAPVIQRVRLYRYH
jgi:hypothetical protein